MTVKMRKIEVAVATADILEARASERGLTVSELLAELAEVEGELLNGQDAELDRRWADYSRTGESYDHADVEAWLRTVGTPEYRSFDEFRAAAKRP